jgi:hypothetical protein
MKLIINCKGENNSNCYSCIFLKSLFFPQHCNLNIKSYKNRVLEVTIKKLDKRKRVHPFV